MGELRERFPLFPLGLVLLPTEIQPLHIFEERYKLMIGRCIDDETEFGIVWLSDDGLKDVGCTARVSQLLERLEDGRMNVLAQGDRPFRLLRRIDDMEFPAGDVELLDDEPEEVDPDVADAVRAGYGDLVERVTDDRPSEEDLAALDAYGMAATIEFPPDAKQDLLEERSEGRRLDALARLFETTVKRLEAAERAQEVAQTNGKVRF